MWAFVKDMGGEKEVILACHSQIIRPIRDREIYAYMLIMTDKLLYVKSHTSMLDIGGVNISLCPHYIINTWRARTIFYI
jgi:hypothetical protein